MDTYILFVVGPDCLWRNPDRVSHQHLCNRRYNPERNKFYQARRQYPHHGEHEAERDDRSHDIFRNYKSYRTCNPYYSYYSYYPYYS